MTAGPEVTVVIPTRNRWSVLSVALTAALCQQDVDLEVIVVDDGSSDETPAALARLKEPRLRVVRHDVQRGPATARNTGVNAARGDWLAFLDDDDLWSPQKLRRQLDAVVADSALFSYCSGFVVDEGLNAVELIRAVPPQDIVGRLLRTNVVPGGGSNVVVRAELVRRLGGFDDELVPLEDWDLAIRLAATARGAMCAEPLLAYRVHRSNSATQARDSFASLRRLARKHHALSAAYGMDFDRVQFVRWVTEERHRTGKTSDVARAYVHAAVTSRSARDILGVARVALESQADKIRRTPSVPRPRNPEWIEMYRRGLVTNGS